MVYYEVDVSAFWLFSPLSLWRGVGGEAYYSPLPLERGRGRGLFLLHWQIPVDFLCEVLNWVLVCELAGEPQATMVAAIEWVGILVLCYTSEVGEAATLEGELHSHFVTDDILHGVDAILWSVLDVETLLL